MSNLPLALYIHLPWCVRKCPYCDFNSHQRTDTLPEAAYVDALLADLTCDLALAPARSLHSIFIGGGTPSLFSGAAIKHLLDGIRDRIPITPGAETTLEANPGTVDEAAFADYYGAGVNRLSIGIQSLRTAQLNTLGRIHSAEDARRAVKVARAVGFTNLNLDVMHGLPCDLPGDAVRELEQALELAPEHLSWYQLTLEPGTAFARSPPVLPGHDQIADDFERGVELMASNGFNRYEVSAFARTGRESQHNLNYWLFGDYLGIGAGAHGKLTTAEGVVRTTKRIQPTSYMKGSGNPTAVTYERRAGRELILEFMLNALRLPQGFTRELFTARTGLAAAEINAPVTAAVRNGWLVDEVTRVRPTVLGLNFLNDLQQLFLE